MASEHDSVEWRKARARARQVFEPTCVSCGKHLEGNDFTIDHIVPLNKGGTHDLNNLQPMCRKCNGKKQDGVPKRTNWFNDKWA